MVAVTLTPVTRPARLGWAGSLLAAGLATLARPATWPVALAAFLVRGGIVILALPIVILPTTSGLADVFAPFLASAYLGRLTLETMLLIAAGAGALVAIVIGGGLVATWLDGWLVREAARDDELGALARSPGSRSGVSARGLAVRMLAYLPLAVALAWATGRLAAAAYAELTLPDDLPRPLVVRVLARVPEVAAVVGGAWILGEVVGGLALRHLVLTGASIPAALRAASRDLVRRPLSTLATTVVTDAGLALAAVLGILGSAAAAERLRMTVGVRGSELEAVTGLLLLAGVWAATLLAIGALAAFRSIAWTFEFARTGTIGRAEDDPAGDWALPSGFATLSQTRPVGRAPGPEV